MPKPPGCFGRESPFLCLETSLEGFLRIPDWQVMDRSRKHNFHWCVCRTIIELMVLNQPTWKISVSRNGFIFPKVRDETSKNVWNHHLVIHSIILYPSRYSFYRWGYPPFNYLGQIQEKLHFHWGDGYIPTKIHIETYHGLWNILPGIRPAIPCKVG